MLSKLKINNNNNKINKKEIFNNNNKLHFVCTTNNIPIEKQTQIEYKCQTFTDFYSAIEYYNNNENKKLKIITPISNEIELKNNVYIADKQNLYFWE